MDSNRMRKLFLFGAFILFMTGVSAQQDSLKYRISLKDKAATEYSLNVLKSSCRKRLLSDVKSRIFRLILLIFRCAANI